MEATIMGNEKATKKKQFNPSIEYLPMDLSVESSDIHFNIAIGPKAALDIGIPWTKLALGFGIRLDVLRFDTRFGDFKSKISYPS